jgi:hypothetical protein
MARRILARDSAVLFLKNQKVAFVGVIVMRSAKDMLEFGDHNFNHLRIGVELVDDSIPKFCASFQRVFSSNGLKALPIADHLFQSSSSLFSYQPILKRLQAMNSIPFNDIIAHKQLPIKATDPVEMPKEMSAMLQADLSQYKAVQCALEHNFSLIQGPPGTGRIYFISDVIVYGI